MSATAQVLPTYETIRDAFINSAEYKSRIQHRVTDPYSVQIALPFNRKAAGDPVTLQTVQTAPGVQPAGVAIGLIDFIPETPVNASSLSVPIQGQMGTEVAPVATGGTKPAVTDAYTSSVIPVETIAGWIKLSTQVLDDAAVAGYSLTAPLLRAVRRAEESQIINGSGVSPQLKGVLSTSIASAASLSAAISAIGTAGYVATMVVVNPADAEKVRAAAQTAGAAFYNPNTGMQVAYGISIYSSIACPVGTGIVGDWAGASMIWRRWDARILVGLVNDDIIKNLVTVVGESRLAFAVTHVAGFNKFTIT